MHQSKNGLIASFVANVILASDCYSAKSFKFKRIERAHHRRRINQGSSCRNHRKDPDFTRTAFGHGVSDSFHLDISVCQSVICNGSDYTMISLRLVSGIRTSKDRTPHRIRHLHDTQSDVAKCSRDRDPPGQESLYIPPGNHAEETYRLATFAKFPNNVPIKETELAMAGFYFTGFKDRAKCFSCGMTVENFCLGDDALSPQLHLAACRMISGRETTNIPSKSAVLRILLRQVSGKQTPNLAILSNQDQVDLSRGVPEASSNLTGMQNSNDRLTDLTFGNIVDSQHEDILRSLNLRKEVERRKTFAQWPSYPCPYLPAELAKEGFFYLGNLDRAQCFSCSGVLRNWARGDVVREQHRRHFNHCRMANGTDPRNQPMTSEQRRIADEEDNARMAAVIPNENTQEPPDLSHEEQLHLALYIPCQNPVNRHMQSVQCRIQTFNRWPREKTRATPQQMAAAGLFYLGESDKTKCFYCNGGLQNWDWNDEPWTEHAKWFPGCEFVLRQKGVDFVRTLTQMNPNLNRPILRNPVSYEDIPRFVPRARGHGRDAEEVAPMETTGAVGGVHLAPPHIMVQEEKRGAARPKEQRTPSPQESIDSSMVTSIREIEESLLCRICKVNKAEAIVLPCAHLCACHDCVASMKKCVACGHKVQEFMKVYRA